MNQITIPARQLEAFTDTCGNLGVTLIGFYEGEELRFPVTGEVERSAVIPGTITVENTLGVTYIPEDEYVTVEADFTDEDYEDFIQVIRDENL